jgi:SAM-dependent methyltransferase
VSGDYAVLAPIYNTIGMDNFAEAITPRVFVYAQAHFDWIGRRVLEMGCGTGASARWLATRGVNITAVDVSAEMLAQARASIDASGLGLTWKRADIRALDDSYTGMDMVLAIDVMNDLLSLRDLEAVFSVALRVLEPGKLLIFDLHTIEGLAERGRAGGSRIHDDADLSVFTVSDFDYERQANTTDFIIYRRQEALWAKEEASLTLRGFPLQAVAALLQRRGFSLLAVLDTNFEPFDPASSHGSRVFFFAQKPGGEEELG